MGFLKRKSLEELKAERMNLEVRASIIKDTNKELVKIKKAKQTIRDDSFIGKVQKAVVNYSSNKGKIYNFKNPILEDEKKKRRVKNDFLRW